MPSENKLEIHTKPKQPVQINRPLIITISIVVFTVILFAILGAFTTTKRMTTSTNGTATKLLTNKPLVISPELKELPENYSDIEAIKRFTPESKSAELAALLQRFTDLQNEYSSLKQQLLTKETKAPEKPPENPQVQQAKQSSLVFSNVSTGVDSMLGAGDKSKPFQTDNTAVPTPEQEKLIKKQTRDEQKMAVIKGKDNADEIFDLHNIVAPMSPYQIHAGTAIPATLITAINTSVAGSVVAQVRQNIYDSVTGKHLLIPRGSRLFGEYTSYSITYGQSRVAIAFNRLIRPDGSSILLGKFNNADLLGHAGVEGDVNNHWGQILAAATLSTVFSVGMGIASERGGHYDQNQYYPGVRERALTSATGSINTFGQSIANRALNITPTITLPEGSNFNVIVKKDVILTPLPKRY